MLIINSWTVNFFFFSFFKKFLHLIYFWKKFYGPCSFLHILPLAGVHNLKTCNIIEITTIQFLYCCLKAILCNLRLNMTMSGELQNWVINNDLHTVYMFLNMYIVFCSYIRQNDIWHRRCSLIIFLLFEK